MVSIKGLSSNETDEKAASHAYLCQYCCWLYIDKCMPTTERVKANACCCSAHEDVSLHFYKSKKLRDVLLNRDGKICCANLIEMLI